MHGPGSEHVQVVRFTSGPLPVVISSAEGAWLTDTQGNRYLDGLSALFSVNAGHGREELGHDVRYLCYTGGEDLLNNVQAMSGSVNALLASVRAKAASLRRRTPRCTGSRCART